MQKYRAQRRVCRNVLSVMRFLWKSTTFNYMYYYSTLFRNRVALNKIFSSIIQWPVYWYLHSVHEIPIVYCCKLHVSLTKLCGREIALTKLCERDIAFFFKVDNPIVIVHIYLVLSWVWGVQMRAIPNYCVFFVNMENI